MKEPSVLIVEDDEVAAEILQQFVHHHRPQARVEWCWNGYEALVRVQDFQPDLILLDYMMPKLDGREFIATLRTLDSCRGCHIAVISAYVDRINEKGFLDLGAQEVLSKPVNSAQIAALLDRVAAERAAI